MFHFLLGRETASAKSGLFFRVMKTKYDDNENDRMFIIMFMIKGDKGIPLQNKQNTKIERGKYLHLGAEDTIKQSVANIYI